MDDSAGSEQPETGNKTTPESGTIAGIERTFLRLTFWQTILSVAGVFTGAVALYAALTESQAVRQQTAASVWPYVQFMINDRGDGDSAFFSLSLDNVGVGPARMRAMQLTLNGQPVTHWQAMTEQLLEEGVEVGVEYGKNSVSSRVLAPGESVVAFQTHHTELARKLQAAVYSGAAGLSYCYCSIFDECWTVDSLDTTSGDGITAVEQCPDFGDGRFRD